MRAARLLILAALLALTMSSAGQARTHGLVYGPGDVAVGVSGKPLPLRVGSKSALAKKIARTAERGTGLAVGTDRIWPALDDAEGFVYLKNYTLRGVGEHIEVWVANDSDELSTGTEFLPDDCRNNRVEITEEQVAYLINEFDTRIYPRESRTLSVPPPRDGSEAQLVQDPELELPADYYEGDGDKIVVLVDNFRDSNFYNFSLGDPADTTYIAGFYASFFDDFVDRLVMNIDAFDWAHRTGPNPPDEPVPGDLCASAAASPFLYEGVFAHEYEHLLENYANVDQYSWVNEGLADWAAGDLGYFFPAAPITDTKFEGGTQCFLGWIGVETPANPNPNPGGPENSLTLWGDQIPDNPDETLCDYGAAFTFTNFLADRYGTGLIKQLHNGATGDGLPGVKRLVRQYGNARQAREIVHHWAAMVALDSYLDGANVAFNGKRAWYHTESLDASINWETEDAWDTPGAPPNGSDYVRLRGAGGYLSSDDVGRISFDGADTLPPQPIEWTVDPSPPGHPDDPALYSGSGPNFDRAIVQQVEVPADNPTLSFETLYDIEFLWDYGFVQVSTDGGRTYKSLANEHTTSDIDPAALPLAKDNLPGFTGLSGGGDTAEWVTESFDLTAYAGQTILLAFRYVTDTSVDPPGWWIDDVKVGDTELSTGTTLNGWATPTQIRPIRVSGFTVQLLAYTTSGPKRALLHRLELRNRSGSLSGQQLRRLFGGADYDVVSAIVTYDDPSEQSIQYAPYRLVVHPAGTQPGG